MQHFTHAPRIHIQFHTEKLHHSHMQNVADKKQLITATECVQGFMLIANSIPAENKSNSGSEGK
jgi:hypothetical protein